MKDPACIIYFASQFPTRQEVILMMFSRHFDVYVSELCLTKRTGERQTLVYFQLTLVPGVSWEAVTHVESRASRVAWVGLTGSIPTRTRHDVDCHVETARGPTSVSRLERKRGGLVRVWLPFKNAVHQTRPGRPVTWHGNPDRHSFRIRHGNEHFQEFVLQGKSLSLDWELGRKVHWVEKRKKERKLRMSTGS